MSSITPLGGGKIASGHLKYRGSDALNSTIHVHSCRQTLITVVKHTAQFTMAHDMADCFWKKVFLGDIELFCLPLHLTKQCSCSRQLVYTHCALKTNHRPLV